MGKDRPSEVNVLNDNYVLAREPVDLLLMDEANRLVIIIQTLDKYLQNGGVSVDLIMDKSGEEIPLYSGTVDQMVVNIQESVDRIRSNGVLKFDMTEADGGKMQIGLLARSPITLYEYESESGAKFLDIVGWQLNENDWEDKMILRVVKRK